MISDVEHKQTQSTDSRYDHRKLCLFTRSYYVRVAVRHISKTLQNVVVFARYIILR